MIRVWLFALITLNSFSTIASILNPFLHLCVVFIFPLWSQGFVVVALQVPLNVFIFLAISSCYNILFINIKFRALFTVWWTRNNCNLFIFAQAWSCGKVCAVVWCPQIKLLLDPHRVNVVAFFHIIWCNIYVSSCKMKTVMLNYYIAGYEFLHIAPYVYGHIKSSKLWLLFLQKHNLGTLL